MFFDFRTKALRQSIITLTTLALASSAHAELVHFTVSGGGASHLPILGKFVDIQVSRGTASFDSETGRFEMVVTKRVESWLVGSAELTTHHIITPDRFTGRDLFFRPDRAVRAMLSCEPIERFSCDRVPFPFGEFIQWESLFGATEGARLTFLGDKADFYGSGLEMPVTVADGSILRIVWTDTTDEFIDFHLTEVSQEGANPENSAAETTAR